MTSEDQKRLASIRMEVMKWQALNEGATWDGTFLLRIIDELSRENRRLKTESFAK